MAGNFKAGAGAETASQGRTAMQGSYVPVRQAPVQQVPAGYQLAYQVGGPRYMYGETPFYGARYADGGIVPGQIYGNMRGSREGADMFGFWPTMFQSSPYATASQMYTPGLGVMPLIGYPSKYPHVVMGGYSDYGSGIVNQAMGMMLPLLMMGLYRQMFPMMPQAPAQAAKAGGGARKSGGGSGGGSGGKASEDGSYKYLPLTEEAKRVGHYQNLEEALALPDSQRNPFYQGLDPDYGMRNVRRSVPEGGSAASAGASPAGSSILPQGTRDEIRRNWPRVERGLQATALVPGAMKTSANALFGPSRSTHEALLRARDNPVAIPDNVRRAFGGGL